jgi:hypothetical protein
MKTRRRVQVATMGEIKMCIQNFGQKILIYGLEDLEVEGG